MVEVTAEVDSSQRTEYLYSIEFALSSALTQAKDSKQFVEELRKLKHLLKTVEPYFHATLQRNEKFDSQHNYLKTWVDDGSDRVILQINSNFELADPISILNEALQKTYEHWSKAPLVESYMNLVLKPKK